MLESEAITMLHRIRGRTQRVIESGWRVPLRIASYGLAVGLGVGMSGVGAAVRCGYGAARSSPIQCWICCSLEQKIHRKRD